MSYTAVSVTSTFTSNAGQSTTDEINKIVTSLATTIYDLANDESLLSGFSQVMKRALLAASNSFEVQFAVDDEDPESLCSALHDLIHVSGDRITLSANSEEGPTYTLLEPLLFCLLPLMQENQTTLVIMINDSRDGISSSTSVVSKDATITPLDEFLESKTLVAN